MSDSACSGALASTGIGASLDLLQPFVDTLDERIEVVRFDVPGRRCRRLVLVSTATGSLMVSAPPHVLRTMVTPRRYRDPEYAVTVAAELYGGQMRERPDEVRRLIHQHSLPGADLHAHDGGHLGLVTSAGELAPRIAGFLRD